MNFSSPRFRLGWILIAIGLANALFWTAFRWNFENHLDHAQITLDFDDTRSLADAYGKPQKQLLLDLKERGATSLAIYDQTLGTLRDNARIAINSRETAELLYPQIPWSSIKPIYRYLVISDDSALIDQITPRLLEQSTTSAPVQAVALGEGKRGILIPNSKQLVGDAQLGYDPQQVQFIRDLGFSITARLSNPLNLTPKRLTTLLDDTKKTGAKVVIFAEDEVLGYESLLSGAAREMRRRGLIFTNIEFSKQRGGGDFAKATEGELVRLHSITPDESSRAKPEVVIDRFVRAVKERNMRVIYVRLLRQQKGEPAEPDLGGQTSPTSVGPRSADTLPPLEIEKTPYTQNIEFVGQISQELGHQALPLAWLRPGFVMGDAQPFGDYPNAQFTAKLGAKGAKVARFLMLFLSGVGVVGATMLLLNLFFDWSAQARRNWLIGGLALAAVLSCSAGIGARLLALQAGLTFPVVAILWGGLPLVWDGLKTLESRKPAAVALLGFKILWQTTLLTLIGGLLVVAFLNNWKYMSKADEFLGEKATQFIPLLIVPLAFLGEIFPHRVEKNGAAPGQQLALSRVNRALSQPFTARIAFLSLVTLAVGYVWMARFGNESGMEISSLELSLRATLEKVFITRPRTKEIFMGHPAFLVTVLFMLRRQKLLAWGALVLATIGQTDVFNTMCHIHTPVFYSLWRSLTGVVLGALGGWIALWFFDKISAHRPLQARGAREEAELPDEAKSLNFTF